VFGEEILHTLWNVFHCVCLGVFKCLHKHINKENKLEHPTSSLQDGYHVCLIIGAFN